MLDKKTINDYYFTLIFLTILTIFSISVTSFYSKNIILYIIMSFVILLSTLSTEIALNKKYGLQEKAKKMMVSIIPINLVIFSVFLFFIFS
ncbi:hypothetical protein [Staphylococcus lutrae]|uniref:Uncharacterized protein n=1 Tax=Staphylococcus lutrae TaxID=155085 RepID=A0AAC9RP42_9STAP|nr:hypothetical protein [Staphylococcus lutrae]ARJ50871.1 hypothetical protein B5P37_05815 [Staphylococcus lutrae]PNZ34125.1 hypothetical protein CD134_10930 [Staphylococcus lutrae]